MPKPLLTEDQYEELRRYEDGKPLCCFSRPNRRLLAERLVMPTPGTGDEFYEITAKGRQALTAILSVGIREQ